MDNADKNATQNAPTFSLPQLVYYPGADSSAMQPAFKMSLLEIEEVLGGKKQLSDKTKLANTTLGNYARVKTAEVHEKALIVALCKKGIEDPGAIPAIPPVPDLKQLNSPELAGERSG